LPIFTALFPYLMNLVIDVGNTTVKLAAFEGNVLVEAFEGLTTDAAIERSRAIAPVHILISSVGGPVQPFQEALKGKSTIRILDHTLPVPLTNRYETPETLGADRLAAVAGAKVLYPNESCLVIDLGTCITYDFIDQENNYLGGSISPGLRMRLKAMHTFTARLPLLEPEAAPLIGRNTRQAMLSGAVNGMAAELTGIIQEYAEQFGPFRILTCGGDAAFFERRIKAAIFVVPTLVLIGLNSILLHNLSHSCH
jgi:type III pantothenate kinase